MISRQLNAISSQLGQILITVVEFAHMNFRALELVRPNHETCYIYKNFYLSCDHGVES